MKRIIGLARIKCFGGYQVFYCRAVFKLFNDQ